jgi:2-dehydro-3-deoxyphosphogalactonate aldolase
MPRAGSLIVSPNFDAEVVRAAVQLGMICCPVVATMSEAFAALAAGAHALKMFPAEMLTPPVVKAWRAVLPSDVRCCRSADHAAGMAVYRAAGRTASARFRALQAGAGRTDRRRAGARVHRGLGWRPAP